MNLIYIVVVFASMVLVGCVPTATVIHPQTDWKTSPAPGGGELPPRTQIYEPGGRGSYNDTGEQRDGRPTGLVFFGPAHATGNGIGASDSKAEADIMCAGSGPSCKVTIAVSGQWTGPAVPPDEYLVLSVQALDAQGNPTGAPVSEEHAARSGPKSYTLQLNVCGNVRVTTSFRENVGPNNPPGIQTKFSSQISRYGCD